MKSTIQSSRKVVVINSQRTTKTRIDRKTKKHEFSKELAELIPAAVSRSTQRRKPDDYGPFKRRNQRDRRRAGDHGPVFRDWGKEFGKPVGDPRPNRRTNLGPLLMEYEADPDLETLSSLIVVEGLRDWIAVKKAINAPIFVCDGTSILDHAFDEYVKRTVSGFEGDVILLMDPDTAGRRVRTAIHPLMTPCKHAFVSEYDSVIGMGTFRESIGVQHCSPETIKTALENPKECLKRGENEIQFDTLYEMRLVQSSSERIEGVRLRRRFFCGLLGIGFCDCKQLIKQLNKYNFALEELDSALVQADALVEEWNLNPWKLQKDYAKQY